MEDLGFPGSRHPSSPEPLPQLDAVSVGVADLRSRVGLANPRAPNNVDTLGAQIVDRLLHIFDFERDQQARITGPQSVPAAICQRSADWKASQAASIQRV